MRAKRKAIAVEDKPRIGRPTKYRPEMCEQAVAIFSEGGSKAEVCVALGINKDTLILWTGDSQHRIPEFSEAIKRGLLKAEAWWEQKARMHLVDEPGQGKLNTALWFINMKNRFGWRDQVDHNVSGTIKVTHEQALDALIGKPLEAITVEHERISDQRP
jgi:transposase